MNDLRQAAQQALEALIENARLLGVTQAEKGFGCYSQEDANLERAWHEGIAKHSATIRAALAQQAEPVEPVALIDPTRGFVRWSTETTPPEVVASYKRAGWTPITPHQPQIEDRLARHGIPMPGDAKC